MEKPGMSRLKTHQPMEHHPITLHQWEELVAECVGLSIEKENITIQLLVQGQELDVIEPISQNAHISSAAAEKWVGNKIGILKTGDPLRAIVVRIIKRVCEDHSRSWQSS
jgi:hypothetical protein